VALKAASGHGNEFDTIPTWVVAVAYGLGTTWDGLPISSELPHGATIVVFRRIGPALDVLLLHRAHNGPHYEGDWAWTPPAGARLPGEPIEDCARRELHEETGLDLPIRPTECGSADWCVFVTEAAADALVVLDAEHDRHEWVPAQVAVARCRPVQVSEPLRAALELIEPA
jgi:8-oxo-dGTP pyrophosphatase MutT (NUDIX family)